MLGYTCAGACTRGFMESGCITCSAVISVGPCAYWSHVLPWPISFSIVVPWLQDIPASCRCMQGEHAYRLEHPTLSSVLFLSGDGAVESNTGGATGGGGPTLILDQTAQQGLAARGWAAQPAFGRLLVFPGCLLHSVLPGKGWFNEMQTHCDPFGQAPVVHS